MSNTLLLVASRLALLTMPALIILIDAGAAFAQLSNKETSVPTGNTPEDYGCSFLWLIAVQGS